MFSEIGLRKREESMTNSCVLSRILTPVFALALLVAGAFAQETTGGLQGTVKDQSGAVVSHAQVVVTGASLVGKKEAETDSSGYYRFANLPPGTYTLTITAKGFSTMKREGLDIQVGHLPSVDFKLEVGAGSTVVEVNAAAPEIDVTTNTTLTNITEDVVQDVPHGRSFQSVIQFAPAARNEPLAGSNFYNAGTGTGGTSPGNGSNGNNVGFMVAGGSDSENSYLVEGQETADLAGGFSHSNVPFDFIEEVQVKTSGVEAEHGGALGGVVNVVMKKGSNGYHGSVFAQFENGGMDGSPVAYQRYDPNNAVTTPTSGVNNIDAPYQLLQPIRPKTSDVYPGFIFGGPIIKDRIFFFLGFNPEWNDIERKVNYGPNNGGVFPFSRNTQTYFTTARLDASLSQKIRVFGSWLYQYQRQTGENLPLSDSTTGLYNVSTGCFASSNQPCLGTGIPKFAFAHGLGYSAPNLTTNFGADITINPRLVSTTRFGYYFQNYHDFGFPTDGELTFWQDGSQKANDAFGNPLPLSLQQANGYFNAAQNQNDTQRNADKAIQFDQDLAWFKSGWWGTHNFKFGYQLNRLSNDISQHWNEPATLFFVGDGNPANPDFNSAAVYSPTSKNGSDACALLTATYGACTGQYGYVTIEDFGSLGKATSFNHGLFVQDAWTIGRGITINAGVRVDKEYLPGEGGTGAPNRPINFGWGDKVAPRIGVAWDVFKDGRMKVFGSYGKFYDIMKLNLAISSFGGQYWQNCVYALNTSDLSTITPVFNNSGRFCGGPGTDSTTEANFKGGSTPPGLTFIENTNFRAFPTTCSTCSPTQEGVTPGLKPYEQHESVFGVDYQLRRNLAFEARWDRRRLDHVIEDSALFNPAIGETFVINNPGQGVASTFNGFWNFLYGCSPSNPGGCATPATTCDPVSGLCPPSRLIPGARSYDGLELRLTKTSSQRWFAMFSYTYSRLRGNYTGLTTTDIADGGGGRNAPNNSRSFDEPYFSFNANGGSSSGLLPTDRPHAFKGYAYYEMPWGKISNKLGTDFGIFQVLYSGSPLTSYLDVGFSSPGAWPVDIVGRGKWVDVTEDPTTGAVTVGTPRTNRTPWYAQTDFNIQQNYKLREEMAISFSVTFTNLLNQRAVTSVGQQIDSNITQSFITPGNTFIASNGFYANAERPYDVQSLLNQANFGGAGSGNTINSQYGKPYLFQSARTIRLGVKFTF
jgi:outer membrane receptor protein involved in Fe transport